MVLSESDLNLFGGTSLVFLEYLQAYEEDNGSTKSTKSCHVVNICRHTCTHWFTAQDFWGCQQYAFRCFYYNFCDPDDNADPVGPGNDDNAEHNTGGGTGSNGSSGNNDSGYADEPHPEEEDNIDATAILSNDRTRCLYNLFMRGNYSLFNQTIRAFESTDDVDLIFKLTNGSPRTDSYRLETDNQITIFLNPNEAESILDLADQILHEGVHAAIAVYLNNRNVDVTLYNRSRLRELYDFYKSYNNPNFQDHIYMAENYIQPISNVLRSLDGNKYPTNYYYGIVWEGLGYWNQNYPQLVAQYGNSHQYNSIVRNNTSLCD